jgi:NAD(P)-dependent dehydrogenase (short-subunit alcohol dehydrogenase family)
MVERRFGRIINFGSISSTNGGYRQGHYASAKAGLVGLTQSVALEFAPVGITCNAVLPGPIETPRLASMPEDVRESTIESIPAGRFGLPAEVAAAVAFLARPDSSYVNGVVLPVDGGAMLLQFRFARPTRFDPPPNGDRLSSGDGQGGRPEGGLGSQDG